MLFDLWDGLRRTLAAREPFPPAWRSILEARVPFYARLSAGSRERFEHKLKVFARTKEFTGAGGLEVTEEMRVVVSATAARLIIHLPDEHYQRLLGVVLYASHYKHPEEEHIVFGEANELGTVVLSWDAVLRGLEDPRDGLDTAIHEFAHALDIENGEFNGTPELAGDAYAAWARVMTSALHTLRTRRPRARPVLRDYGAKNPAEFFAVATEAFYEKPQQMKQKHPALYRQLSAFYGSDPASGRE